MNLHKNTVFLDGVASTNSFLQNYCSLWRALTRKSTDDCRSSWVQQDNAWSQSSPTFLLQAVAHRVLHYQCPKDSVGTEIEAAYKNARDQENLTA